MELRMQVTAAPSDPVQKPETSSSTKKKSNYTSRHDKIFKLRIKELAIFKAQSGHANPPQSFSTGLYRWCHRKRTAKRLETLPLDHEEGLLAIGFNFQSKAYTIVPFETRLQQLKEFKDQHGHFKVPINFDKGLHIWTQHLRGSLKAYQEGISPHIRLEQTQLIMVKDMGLDDELNCNTQKIESNKLITSTAHHDEGLADKNNPRNSVEVAQAKDLEQSDRTAVVEI